ncbi:agmatinase [Spirulina sp. CS-785/01]|uniref:agmatinase n=1 Tax=Spirulina sp. CS-785/01 TaxID=3021716 RepID=UPI00232C6FD0|nr:agmatinase [Spirulina sp. CS-785/01]MDB9311497.1 agmatinase [Spirulina sp. CS-785/01]
MLPLIGSEIDQPYETAEVVILPVPYEMTTTYRKGCQRGPEALLAASDQLEYYDVELQREICFGVGIHTYHPIPLQGRCAIANSQETPHLTPEKMVKEVETTVSQLLADNKFIITLGGEHSITAGVVAAYQQDSPEPFTVVQIDAHGDLRDNYEGSKYNHACVMRRVVEQGIPTLAVGLRSLCQEEAEFIESHSLPVVWGEETANNPDWIEAGLTQINTPNIFITIDLDGLDPSICAGVGTPQPGGLSWYQTTRFLRRLFETYRVLGCDVMELSPLGDSVVSEFTAAKLVYKLIGYHTLNP